MAMKKEDKLTKQMVIDGVMAIIRPIPEKKQANGDRGAALFQAMLSRAGQTTKQPRQIPSGRQTAPPRPITPPTPTPPPITPIG